MGKQSQVPRVHASEAFGELNFASSLSIIGQHPYESDADVQPTELNMWYV